MSIIATGRRAASGIAGKMLAPPAERMAPRDTEYLFGEHAGHRNHLVAVVFFDETAPDSRDVDKRAAVEWMSERLDIAPLFTRRIRREFLDLDYPYWVDSEPDLDAHVQVHAIDSSGWTPAGDVLAAIVGAPMDLTRPPWELHVITGISDVRGMPKRMTAAVLKLHHSAADGLAIRTITWPMFTDQVCDAPVSRSPQTVPACAMGVRAVAGIPRTVFRFVRRASAAKRDAREISEAEDAGLIDRAVRFESTVLNGPVTGDPSIDFLTLALEDIAVIKSAVSGSTVNDVLLCVVGGALREFGSGGEDFTKVPLVAKVPRSVRRIEEWDTANQLVLLSIPLHNEVQGGLARLARIAADSRAAKRRSEFPAVRRYAGRIDAAPAPLLKLSAWGSRVGPSASKRADHTMVSNIPIDATGREFFGMPGTGALPNQPPGNGDLLRHYMCFKNSEVLTLNILADPSVIPEMEAYRSALVEEFSMLLRAASAEESMA